MVGAAHSMHSTEPGEMSVAAMTVSVYLPWTFRRNLFFAFASLAPAMRRIRCYVSYYPSCKCSRIVVSVSSRLPELSITKSAIAAYSSSGIWAWIIARAFSSE
mgnify:CR=1 FL=1